MTTITLHKYHEQINQLLEDNQYDLAAEHCRHILQQQPQHIATYRLLAKTLLEKGDYDGARELFQRILSADPNDHIAHAGLAIIFQQEEIPAQAIWHLERAYEIEPYNTAIQQELRTLYNRQNNMQRAGQKNGDTAVAPTTLLLSKGALARLYLRGELYDQATAVLQVALDADEERIDLRVLLMEALWRDGRRMEAVNVAMQVLDQLPNCLAANAILAEIWLQTGRVDEAQTYLQRLQTMLLLDTEHLDPEAPEGSAFLLDGAIPLPSVVDLDYLGEEGALAEFEGTPAWPPGLQEEAEPAETESDDDMYQWLEGLTGELPPLPKEDTAVAWGEEDLISYEGGILSRQAPGIQAAESSPADSDDNLDWLVDEEEETAVPPTLTAAELLRASTEEPDDFAPDWLADLAGEDLEAIQVDPQTAAVWLRQDNLADVEESPDTDDEYHWLETPPDETPSDQIDSESGVLDISQFGRFQFDDEEIEEPEEFEWRLTDELNALSLSSEPAADALPAVDEELEHLDFAAHEDLPADIPDWLMTGSETGDLYEEPQAVEDDLARELADWVAASSPELPSDEDQADWSQSDAEPEALDLVAGSLAGAELSRLAAEDDSAPLDSKELPDWLSSDLTPKVVDSQLLGTDRLAGEADEGLNDGLVSDELPDWLQEGQTAVSQAEDSFSTGDLPDWLQGASLDAIESAPLDESTLAEPADAPELDLPDEFPPPDDEETPTSSDMLRTATELDLSTADELAAAEDLPGWLFAAEEHAGSDLPARSDVDLEEVVSDKKDEPIPDAEDEQDTQPQMPLPPGEDLDWLDDLAAMSESDATGLEVLNDTGELPDWMALDEAELVGAEIAAEDTAVPRPDELERLSPVVPLEEEPDLNWLDALAAAETPSTAVDELPTWQWPEEEAAELADESLENLNWGETAVAAAAETDAAAEAAEAAYPDDLDDAMSWLEELAGEPDAPIEELPTVAEALVSDDLLAQDETPDTADEWAADADFDLPPEDPEAAMAWLEQLAARQGASLDELPSVTAASAPAEAESTEADEPPPLVEMGVAAAAATIIAAEFGADDLDEAAIVDETAVDAAVDLSMEVPEDPDEAMAWLERLAARQGAPLDELPSITDDVDLDDLFAGPAAVEEDDLALAFADSDLFAAEIESEPVDEAPAELDEAMTWLDEMTGDQDVLSGERPSVAALAISDEEELDFLAALPADDLETTARDELAEAMDWLDELGEPEAEEETAVPDWLQPAADESEPSSLPLVPPVLLAELDWLAEEAGLESADVDLSEIDVSDEELALALAQVDLLARPPKTAVAEPEAEVLPDDLADLSADLDALLDEAPDLTADMGPDDAVATTIVTAAIVEEEISFADEPEAAEATIFGGEADLDLSAIPDDPDEAMAWLERLAARQGASLDELPSLYDADEETLAALTALPEADLTDKMMAEPETAVTDVPENIEDAMAWLEQLAARQGASLDELPTVSEAAGELETPDWIAAAQAAGAAGAVSEMDWDELPVDFPDEGEPEMDDQIALTAAGLSTPPAAEAGVPEDIDAAMAWLEKLAARQGASLDELPTVSPETAVTEELDTPDWITAAREAATTTEEAPPGEEAAADEWEDLLFPGDAFDAGKSAPAGAEPIELQSLEAEEETLADDEDTLPDWLTAERDESSPRVVGHTDWLGTLPEPDLDGWLAAEEEATIYGTGSLDADLPSVGRPTGKTGPLPSIPQTGPLRERALPDTADLDEDLLVPDLDLGLSALEADKEQLNAARSALASGHISAALDGYATLVERGEGLNTLIADLEAATGQHSDRPLVRRMLGDAYMRNGQLQKALETYRQALDQM